jgi:hypothetical protein
MIFQLHNELTAYSVQDLGAAWRWRVYSAGGAVACQGVSLTKQGAERAALELFAQAEVQRAA